MQQNAAGGLYLPGNAYDWRKRADCIGLLVGTNMTLKEVAALPGVKVHWQTVRRWILKIRLHAVCQDPLLCGKFLPCLAFPHPAIPPYSFLPALRKEPLFLLIPVKV